MCAESIEHQHKHVVLNFINKKPVRLNMTFTCTFVVTGEIVISVLCFQRSAIRQNIDYFEQLIKILVLLFGKLQIFLN